MPAHRRTHPETLELLQRRAAEMRAQPTPSERALWAELSGSKLGAAFRRQFVIAPFIVDFYCASRRLIVEVDGGYHSEREAAGVRRDGKLRRRGYQVLRLPEAIVLRDRAEAVRCGASARRSARARRPFRPSAGAARCCDAHGVRRLS